MAGPAGSEHECSNSLRDFLSAVDAGLATGALPAALQWVQTHSDGPAVSGIPRFLCTNVLAFRDGARLLEAALFRREELIILASRTLHSPDADRLAKSASALLLYDLGDPAKGAWSLAAPPEPPPLPEALASEPTETELPAPPSGSAAGEAGAAAAGPSAPDTAEQALEDAAAAAAAEQAEPQQQQPEAPAGPGGGAGAVVDAALFERATRLAEELAALDPERTGAALPEGLVALLEETDWSADWAAPALAALRLDAVKDAVTLLLATELSQRDLGLSRSAALLAALLLPKLRAVTSGAPRPLTEAALTATRLQPGPLETGVVRPLIAEGPLSAGLGDLLAKMVAALPPMQQASVLSALCAPAVAPRWSEAEVAVAQAVVSSAGGGAGTGGGPKQPSFGLSPEDFAQLVAGLEGAAPGPALVKSVKFAKFLLSIITSQPKLAAEWKESMRDVVRATSSFMAKSLLAKVDAL